MPVNTVEFRELGKRFIFQGGSPYAIGLANEIDKLRIENKQLREANEAFAKRQAWWTERMFLMEGFVRAAVKEEREACALVCEAIPATCTWMDYDEDCMECARAIRARGGE